MNATANAFRKLLDRTRRRLGYFVEGAIVEFTESVVARMGELNLSNSKLASRLKCKPPYITKVLRGDTNFTLESMVKIALALDSILTIKLTPRVSSVRWRLPHGPQRQNFPSESGFVSRYPAGTTKHKAIQSDEISIAA